jgi:hypothetical protein
MPAAQRLITLLLGVHSPRFRLVTLTSLTLALCLHACFPTDNMGISKPAPDVARKVGAAIGVVTLICGIVANSTTSLVVLKTVYDTGVEIYAESGVWRQKLTLTVPTQDPSTTEEDNTCSTDCSASLPPITAACCDGRSHKCKGSKALAVFGVCPCPLNVRAQYILRTAVLLTSATVFVPATTWSCMLCQCEFWGALMLAVRSRRSNATCALLGSLIAREPTYDLTSAVPIRILIRTRTRTHTHTHTHT